MKLKALGQKIQAFGSSLGRKIYGGIRNVGQKVYDNRYKILAGGGAIATALLYNSLQQSNNIVAPTSLPTQRDLDIAYQDLGIL